MLEKILLIILFVIRWFATNQQSLCGGGYPTLPLLLECLLLKPVSDETLTYVEFRSNPFYLLSSSASGCLSPCHSQMWWFFFSSTANITVAGTWNLRFPQILDYSVQLMEASCPKYKNVYYFLSQSILLSLLQSFFIHFQLLFLNHRKSRKSI